MVAIQLEDVSFLFAVALMHAYQLADNARTIGTVRRKYKINPPEMNGPGEFMRAIRVQQNDLEFALIFEILFWIVGICFHQMAAVILGLMYLYGRYSYKIGYLEDTEKRKPGFYKSLLAIKGLLALSIVGLVCAWLRQFADVDVGAIARKQFQQTTGVKPEL